jgi:ELWxxDGT repeat protein
MLKDIMPGPEHSNINSSVSLGNVLLFSARDSAWNSELWRSDGTPAGTFKVKEINPTDTGTVYEVHKWQGLAYFAASDGTSSNIWKSDGTPLGTTEAVAAPDFTSPSLFGGQGDRLYFGAYGIATGFELWKLENGVAEMVKDTTGDSVSGSPHATALIGDKIYFAAYSNAAGTEPWVSDGTEAGTVMLKDIRQGAMGE